MGVCGCVISNPNYHCHSMPDYLVTMPKSVLDQIGKEHTEEIKRLRQQVAELEKQNAQTIKVNEFLNHKLSEAIKELNKLDVVPKQQGVSDGR